MPNALYSLRRLLISPGSVGAHAKRPIDGACAPAHGYCNHGVTSVVQGLIMARSSSCLPTAATDPFSGGHERRLTLPAILTGICRRGYRILHRYAGKPGLPLFFPPAAATRSDK